MEIRAIARFESLFEAILNLMALGGFHDSWVMLHQPFYQTSFRVPGIQNPFPKAAKALVRTLPIHLLWASEINTNPTQGLRASVVEARCLF